MGGQSMPAPWNMTRETIWGTCVDDAELSVVSLSICSARDKAARLSLGKGCCSGRHRSLCTGPLPCA